jgi:hypothetical protein
MVTTRIFDQRLNLNQHLVEFLIRHNEKSFFLSAGCDFLYFENKSREYGPCEECQSLDYPTGCPVTRYAKTDRTLLSMTNGVIPTAYDYWLTHGHLTNAMPYVPFPINLSKHLFREQPSLEKISFFHGLNRPGFKGTRFVSEAFSLMQQKHGAYSEYLIDGNMPLKNYLELMNRVNVVVDQTSSYCSAMNALFAMAMGKVVLGGSEQASNQFQYGEESPVINIRPNVVSVSEAIEYCLDNRHLLSDAGVRSRAFVEKHHDHISVAERYLEIYRGKF